MEAGLLFYFELLTILCFTKGELGNTALDIVECTRKEKSAYMGIWETAPNLQEMCSLNLKDIAQKIGGSNTATFESLRAVGDAFEAMGTKIGLSTGADFYETIDEKTEGTHFNPEDILKTMTSCGVDVTQLSINIILCVLNTDLTQNAHLRYDMPEVLQGCCLNITHIGQKIESCTLHDTNVCQSDSQIGIEEKQKCLSRHFAYLAINVGNSLSQLALEVKEINKDKDEKDEDKDDKEDENSAISEENIDSNDYKQLLKQCGINTLRIGNKILVCTMDENSLCQTLFNDPQDSKLSNVVLLLKQCGVNPKTIASKFINCTSMPDKYTADKLKWIFLNSGKAVHDFADKFLETAKEIKNEANQLQTTIKYFEDESQCERK